MSRPKIVIDAHIPFIKGALEPFAEVVYLPGREIGAGDVRDADALVVRTRTRCDRALLEGSSVKFIATATIGYDHIDTAWCEANGISWTNAPGCNSSSVEQYMVSALLHLVRHHRLEPGGATLGIIGVGHVGRKVRRAAEALGMKVLCNDPPRERAEGPGDFTGLEELLRRSDIVTLHVPLVREGIDKTRGMADREFLETMQKGAWLINTSRGEVVEDEALKSALANGRLSGAVLDVYNNEPAPDPGLLKEATITTPHIAGYSTDGKANGTKMSVRAVSDFFGLGAGDWEPENIPVPGEPVIHADGEEADSAGFMAAIYNHTYDIAVDDKALREQPGRFESLRGEYRTRREPPAYAVRLYNDDGVYRRLLEQLGFQVLGGFCM